MENSTKIEEFVEKHETAIKVGGIVAVSVIMAYRIGFKKGYNTRVNLEKTLDELAGSNIVRVIKRHGF